MKTMIKPISILLSVLMLMSVFAAAPFTVSAAIIVASGDAGENCIWVLDNVGTLTIRGNGKMEDYSWANPAPWGTDVTRVVIKNGVTSIGEFAFHDCTSLRSVTISDSVTNIGNWAFLCCFNLISITIPHSMTSIGAHAFSHCISLESVSISDGVTSLCIGNGAFFCCKNLNTMVLPNRVASIEDMAFWDCTGLSFVTICDDATSIGEFVFSYCHEDLTIHCKENSAVWNALTAQGLHCVPLAGD